MKSLIQRVSLAVLALMAFSLQLSAQKYYTKAGTVSFQASTAMEEVAATTHAVVALYDISTGAVQIEVFIRGFEFKKALMQEHFNENYMESDKFPKASFTGTFKSGLYDPAKTAAQKVTIAGKLTIHGVTQSVDVSGTITNVDGFPRLEAVFNVKLADYQIKIPSLVEDKIASTAEISFNSLLNKTIK